MVSSRYFDHFPPPIRTLSRCLHGGPVKFKSIIITSQNNWSWYIISQCTCIVVTNEKFDQIRRIGGLECYLKVGMHPMIITWKPVRVSRANYGWFDTCLNPQKWTEMLKWSSAVTFFPPNHRSWAVFVVPIKMFECTWHFVVFQMWCDGGFIK